MAFLKTLAFLTVFVAVSAQAQNQLTNYYNNSSNSWVHSDDYLNAIRRQQAINIWYYDLQIETFKELYLQRINTVDIQKDLLISSLVQADKLLYPLTLLSDLSKKCVQKYKPLVPPLAAAKYEMERCSTNGKNQLNSLITYASSTNRTLQTYYTNTFEKEVQSCKTKFNDTSSLNHTMCITKAVSTADTYTLNNQKQFAAQMNTAESSGNTFVNTALECSYGVLNGTISMISKANTLIERCFQGLDDCENGCKSYTCDNVHYMPSYLIDYKNETMRNPFYGRSDVVDCLMLDIY